LKTIADAAMKLLPYVLTAEHSKELDVETDDVVKPLVGILDWTIRNNSNSDALMVVEVVRFLHLLLYYSQTDDCTQ